MSRKRRRVAEQRAAGNSRIPAKDGRLAVFITAAVLAGIPFCLGKYIEFNSPGPFDSGSYVYSAQNIINGARIGVDEFPSAQPATLLVNIIGVRLFGFSETGPKLIQTFMQIGALVLMFCSMRKLFGSLAAVFAVFIASFYLSAPFIAKFGNVKEQFMVACMVAAASCFILRQLKGPWWWTFIAGALAMNLYYFKPTGISVVIAIVVYLLVQVIFRLRPWRGFEVDILSLVAGAVAGIIPLLTFYAWQGQTKRITGSLPFTLLVCAITVTLVGMAIHFAVRWFLRSGAIDRLRQVRRTSWIAGAVLIAAAFVVSILVVLIGSRTITGSTDDCVSDTILYVKSVAFVKYPMKVYHAAESVLARVLRVANPGRGYLAASRAAIDSKKHAAGVLRYYLVLILPISLALGSITAGCATLIRKILSKRQGAEQVHAGNGTHRFVLFMAIWWALDMVFVWISPRPYEQYYLPLTASAAMLGAYLVWLYSEKRAAAVYKGKWTLTGVVCVICMTAMAWRILFGTSIVVATGQKYNTAPLKRRGFQQKLGDVSRRRNSQAKGMWEAAGEYIRDSSTEDDTIYVWGWVPGIYVKAQRLSTAPKAFESEMHIKVPTKLSREVARILESFKAKPPKFIVDARHTHFPYDGRPKLELWPIVPKGYLEELKEPTFLPPVQSLINKYDAKHSAKLEEDWGSDEAGRFESMEPFRRFVMENYTIAATQFRPHVIFKLKSDGDSR